MATQKDYSIFDMGTVAVVIGNVTSHCFPMGAYVICTPYKAYGHDGTEQVNTYGYCEESESGQYLSSDCIKAIGYIPGIDKSMNPVTIRRILGEWKINPSGVKNLFYSHAARTQKARGLQVLAKVHLSTLPVLLVQSEADLKDQLKHLTYPIMVRPCPTKPRHGFVESKIVKSPLTVRRIFKKTLAADPRGELLLMPPIEAEYSSIVTNNAITMGRGTNGATSGKRCINIPCHGELLKQLRVAKKDTPMIPIRICNRTGDLVSVNSHKYAGLRKNASIFVETVQNHCVQLRTGPKFDSSSSRFSTASSVRVVYVLEVNPEWDFLEYEQKLHSLKELYDNPSQVVVYQSGAALTSHYMVQAIAQGFSVVTDGARPGVNTVLYFDTAPPTFPSVHTAAFHESLKHALAIGYHTTPTEETLQWAAAVIQGIGPASKTKASVSLILTAAVILAKAGIAVCLGEYRHYFRSGPGRHGHIARAPVSFPHDSIDFYSKKGTLSRSLIYNEAFKLDWSTHKIWLDYQSILFRIAADYRRSDWSAGYGGPAWGSCTNAANGVLLALTPFITLSHLESGTMIYSDLVSGYLMDLVAACNTLITVSHNSAKCLTKIVSAYTLEQISEGHTHLTIATSPLTWRVIEHHVKQ